MEGHIPLSMLIAYELSYSAMSSIIVVGYLKLYTCQDYTLAHSLLVSMNVLIIVT